MVGSQFKLIDADSYQMNAVASEILFGPAVFLYFLFYISRFSSIYRRGKIAGCRNDGCATATRRDEERGGERREEGGEGEGEERGRDASRRDADVPSCTKRAARSYFHEHTLNIAPV